MTPPKVIVTFYKNFHFVEVDVSGLFIGPFGTGVETRVGSKDGGSDPGSFSYEARYTENAIRVVASGGTWGLKVLIRGVEYTLGPWSPTVSAASILASLPPELQPRTWHFEPVGETEGKTSYAAVPGAFIDVVDKGTGEWEFHFFVDGGVVLPVGLALTRVEDLGAVMETQPRHDEIAYTVPLEEGCVGGGVRPPPGSIVPSGPRSGRRPSLRPVHGHR